MNSLPKTSAPCSPFLRRTSDGPSPDEGLAGRDEVHLPGDQPDFFVVGEEDVDAAELFEEGLPLGIDPEPDRVHGQDGGFAELAKDEVVVLRVEIGQVDDARAPVGTGIFGRKSAKTLSSVRIVVRRLGSSS